MELKYHKFTLPNGLNVILSENHTLPTAAVNIWYHVGSKDEQEGISLYNQLLGKTIT